MLSGERGIPAGCVGRLERGFMSEHPSPKRPVGNDLVRVVFIKFHDDSGTLAAVQRFKASALGQKW